MTGGAADETISGAVGSALGGAVDASTVGAEANKDRAATPAAIFFVGPVFLAAIEGGLVEEEPATADSGDAVFASFFFFFLFSFDAGGVS